VRHLGAFLRQRERGHEFCVYDASTPKAIRKTAHRNELPGDQITQVRVPDPYFYA
jgi:hypothetical protein